MRKDFRTAEKVTRLIWCDRHCCLCEKSCGIDIELAHIDESDDNDIDNAIPVCYDCHAKMGMYNDRHPRGTKLKPTEIKALRDHVYDRFTSKYVAPLHYIISQALDPLAGHLDSRARMYPDVSLSMANMSEHLGAQILITLNGQLNGRTVTLGLSDPLYTGRKRWNLNPRRVVNGHFKVKNPTLLNLKATDRFEIRSSILLRDGVGRDHSLLEDGYVFDQSNSLWYFEP